jgi:hypothetical protein
MRFRNKAYRKRNLHWTVREPSGITVVHSNAIWEKVPLLSFGGLTLEGRRIVVLSKKLAKKLGCVPGRYLISRDDSLGRRTRILALLGDLVLVAHQGKLGYLAPPEARRPRWLLAWTLRGASFRPPRRGQVRRPPPRRPPPKRPPPKRPPRPRPKAPRLRKR